MLCSFLDLCSFLFLALLLMWLHSFVRGGRGAELPLDSEVVIVPDLKIHIKQVARRSPRPSCVSFGTKGWMMCRLWGEILRISDGGDILYCSFTKEIKKKYLLRAAHEQWHQGIYPCSCLTATRAAWMVCTCKNRTWQVRPSLCMLLATFPLLPSQSICLFGLISPCSFLVPNVFFFSKSGSMHPTSQLHCILLGC